MLAGARAEIDHVIRRPDRFFVVLDDDDRVAEIAKPGERPQQRAVVALVQPDGGLVQHVEHPDQPGADLAGQADPLSLAPGQGGRRAGQ